MNVTIKINGFCVGGSHLSLTATVGGISKDFVFNKADFTIEPEEYDDALLIILRSFIKESGLNNWSNIKTAIEGKGFKL